jgi:hypothetical protein
MIMRINYSALSHARAVTCTFLIFYLVCHQYYFFYCVVANDADNSNGAKANLSLKSKHTLASSGSVKAQTKRRRHARKEAINESPNVEKPLPKKGRLRRAKSPKVNVGSSPNNPKSSTTNSNFTAVNAATSDIIHQSTVVQSVDPAHLLDTGKTWSNRNAESTGFNHELHSLLQHAYSDVPLGIKIW